MKEAVSDFNEEGVREYPNPIEFLRRKSEIGSFFLSDPKTQGHPAVELLWLLALRFALSHSRGASSLSL